MDNFIKSRAKSFRFAFSGIWHVLRTQKNAWIHAITSIFVIGIGLWLGLPASSWAVIVLVMGIVWMAECLNTAIEAVVDIASPTSHPLARISKDTGAAAVLFTAICAIIIGFLVLLPPLWSKFF